MNYIKKLQFGHLAILLVFLSVFAVEYITPMHSDDFSWTLRKLDIGSHYQIYMSWSGRFVADYLGNLILQIHSHLVVSIIMAFLLIALCFLITDIPNKIFNTNFTWWKFLFIFSLYWIVNPALSQTTFWIVGASVYLFTSVFVLLFLWLFIIVKDKHTSCITTGMFILAVIAGCSNENTCLALIYSFICICALFFIKKIRFNQRLAVLCLIGLIIGAAILLLAPGNYARLSHPDFNSWNNMSLYQKIITHFSRVPLYLSYFKLIILTYLLLIFSLPRNLKESDQCLRFFLSLLFLSSSIIAFIVMVGAPCMPVRSYMAMHLFLLIALSFVFEPDIVNIMWKRLYKIITAAAFIVFLCQFSRWSSII